jgi:dual specificity tyrosine-phosphorylation-regulated kinase 2/3/4
MTYKFDYNSLTKFEKDELKALGINDIYYHKNESINLSNTPYNIQAIQLLYDINYRYNIYRNHHLYYRYKILNNLGRGSYSNVVKCNDYMTKSECAIKIYISKQHYQASFENEIKILKMVRYNKYNIHFIDSFKFRGHNCIVTNLYGKSMLSINFNKLILKDKLNIFLDITKGLEFLKIKKIIHGDIKPENILLTNNSNNNAVIADFGLSILKSSPKIQYRYNIQTIWYRSPEIFFKIPFNESIDMWSFGVIFYELMFNNILISTKTDSDLLLNIANILDIPDDNYINSDYRISLYFHLADNKWILNKFHNIKNRIIFPGRNDKLDNPVNNPYNEEVSDKLIELIKKCLVYDMNKRVTPLDARQFIEQTLFLEPSQFSS